MVTKIEFLKGNPEGSQHVERAAPTQILEKGGSIQFDPKDFEGWGETGVVRIKNFKDEATIIYEVGFDASSSGVNDNKARSRKIATLTMIGEQMSLPYKYVLTNGREWPTEGQIRITNNPITPKRKRGNHSKQ